MMLFIGFFISILFSLRWRELVARDLSMSI